MTTIPKEKPVSQTKPETDPHAATIEGENAVVVEDYSWMRDLRNDRLRLVDSSGKPIDTDKPYKGDKHSGMHFCWVTNGKDGRPGRIAEYRSRNYEICKDPDVMAPAADKDKANTEKTVGELTLMWCKWGLYEAWQKMGEEDDAVKIREIHRNVKKNLSPNGPELYGEVKFRRERDTGG